MKKTSTLFLTLLFALVAFAQKTPEQMGGVYYAYPDPQTNAFADIPEGYTPLYISHYGRHGSRWLPHDSRYEWVLQQFADKSNLTPRGRSVRVRLQRVWENARGNGGKLTSLGAKQHRGIARRMLHNFPMIFRGDASVEAHSSIVDRCVKSMEAFADELKAQQPSLHVATVADSAEMRYLSYDSPDLKLLQRETNIPLGISANRFAANLFKNPSRLEDAQRLMSELFTIASDMQDIEGLDINFFDAFTDEEMHALYVWNCAKMFHQNGRGAASRDIPAQCAANLWQDFVDKADEAMTQGRPAAHLRFGHDTALYRLLALLKATPTLPTAPDGIHGKLDEIVPMAANLQLVFCKSATNWVVSFYLNEKPLALSGLQPVLRTGRNTNWYLWDDVKAHGQHYLDKQKLMDRTRAINTMVGTDYAVTPSVGRYGKGSEEHGQTLPAVLEPHGHTYWTPQTQDTEQKCVAPYYYRDSLFQGFRGSHWLVGGCTQDYGSFTLMPMMDSLRLKATRRATPFSHDEEVSHPYYYAVKLPREHLYAEMTGRSRSALFRFTAEQAGEMHVVVNPNSDEGEGFVTVDSARNCIWGYNPVHRIYQGWGERAGFSGWFVVQFQRPFKACGVRDSVAFVTFDVRAGETVLAKAACSFNDLMGAMGNAKEIPGWDFLATRLALDSIWQRRLQTIAVESDDDNKVNQFDGALYRASFLPRVISDRDGHAPQFAKGEHASAADKVCWFPTQGDADRQTYSDFSMWDIYRAQLPLLNIIDPDRTSQMMQSLTTMYTQGGWMPIFPCWNSYTSAMIGDHATSVVADAYVKGNRHFDVAVAYQGLRKNAFVSPKTFKEYQNGMGRRALKSYLKYGYIPMEDSVMEAFHTHEQMSRTLEYAYNDFCVAQLAKALGKTNDYRALMKRARNWRNVLNPQTGWADGRYQNGRWLNNRDITGRVPFITEGAVIHYSFYVPHDVYGLMEAMGGRSAFVSKLDSLFGLTTSPLRENEVERGFYWHGNEPCHQTAYLYAWAGQPWKTQHIVHRILNTEYLDVPGGLSGNDDAGQMSAWYIFSALGFYPVCPATPYYIIGTPSFKRARIGRLTIEAPGVSDDNMYIQSATWNGQPYTKPYITHDMIRQGGTLRFTMGAQPNQSWGTNKEDLPPNTME